MKIKKCVLALMFVLIVGIVCTACGHSKTDESLSVKDEVQENIPEDIQKDDTQEESGEIQEDINEELTETITLNNTYKTKFSEVNAITYPDFLFDYPDNWTISQEEVTQTGETVILTNESGITIKFSHIGGVPEGQLGGGGTYMRRVEISKVADSHFVPGYVQATDYSSLGSFMVAELKVTGELDMQTDSDFTDIDGNVSYAVIPESLVGTIDGITQTDEGAFAFWYSDYISVIASSPSGKFSEAEAYETQMILSSFRIE